MTYRENESKPKDPYWSLWGKLKARHRRAESGLSDVGLADEDDFGASDDAYEDEMARVFRLPRTGVVVNWDGRHLHINGIEKEVRADAHAVNTLRKYNTDADYRKKMRAGR